MCAGRPFFITIGVAQASCAPARIERGDGVRQHLTRDVVDVRRQLDRGRPGRGAVAGCVSVPTSTCTTFGRPAVSAVPAP